MTEEDLLDSLAENRLEANCKTRMVKLAVPIEQKQEEPDQPEEMAADLVLTILKKHFYAPAEGEIVKRLVKELSDLVLSSFAAGVESGKKNSFSLQDMIECWEAGAKRTWHDYLDNQVDAPDKKQYFKTKFNINIDDKGKLTKNRELCFRFVGDGG